MSLRKRASLLNFFCDFSGDFVTAVAAVCHKSCRTASDTAHITGVLEVFPAEFGFAFEESVKGDKRLMHDGSPLVKHQDRRSLLLVHRDAGGPSYRCIETREVSPTEISGPGGPSYCICIGTREVFPTDVFLLYKNMQKMSRSFWWGFGRGARRGVGRGSFSFAV